MGSRFIKVACSALLAVIVKAEAPTPQAILAKAKEVQGGSLWGQASFIRGVGRLETAGLAGPIEMLESLKHAAYVARVDLGAIKQVEGFDGKTSWVQDSSGQSVVQGGLNDNQDAANQAYLSSRAYWFPERIHADISYLGKQTQGTRAFQVLQIHPHDGRTFELWVDANTWLFDHMIDHKGSTTEVTTWSDYRSVEGLELPFTIRTSTGDPQSDQLIRFDHFTLNEALEQGAFSMPAPLAPDCGFDSDKGATIIPIELDPEGHVHLQANLNGQGPYWFCLDTGASMSTLTPTGAKVLGLKGEGSFSDVGGVGEASTTAKLTQIERLQVGESWIKKLTFAILPGLEGIQVNGKPCQGLLGFEIFKRYVVRIDYGNHTLALIEPKGWSYSGPGITVPFVFNGHIPQVKGELDGIAGDFTIDTGSLSTMEVSTPFVANHHLLAKAKIAYPSRPSDGVGGSYYGMDVRAEALKLGAVSVKNPIVSLSTMKGSAFTADGAIAGNVGSGFFRRFTVTFDYPHQAIHFERGTQPDQRDHYPNTSGLKIDRQGSQLTITAVLPSSPAQEAGLQPGDQILEMGGRTSQEVSTKDVTGLVDGTPGTRIRIKVRDGKEERTVDLVLRELL